MNQYESSGKVKMVGPLLYVGRAMVLTHYRGLTLFNSFHDLAYRSSMEYHSRELSSAKRLHWWLLSSMAPVLVSILWSSWFLLQSSIGQRYPCKYSSTAFVSFGTSQSAALVSLSSGRNLSVWILKSTFEIISVIFMIIVA